MQQVFVDVDVEHGRHEGMRESQRDASVESPAFLLEGLFDKGHGVDERFGFASLEAGGYCINGVEEEVCNPREEARGHGGDALMKIVIPGLKVPSVI